jgi:hypothetical protein
MLPAFWPASLAAVATRCAVFVTAFFAEAYVFFARRTANFAFDLATTFFAIRSTDFFADFFEPPFFAAFFAGFFIDRFAAFFAAFLAMGLLVH